MAAPLDTATCDLQAQTLVDHTLKKAVYDDLYQLWTKAGWVSAETCISNEAMFQLFES